MIKRMILQIIGRVVYFLYYRGIIKMKHNIEVVGIEETIDMLLATNKSLVRFGDGEIAMIRGKDLVLQKKTGDLPERMAKLLRNDEEGLAVAIVDMINGLGIYQKSSQRYWENHLLFCRKIYDKYCTSSKYYSAFFSRCYITLADKSRCDIWFDKIRHIWADKDVTVVEGGESKNGVYNNLLTLASSVERIICPARDAYEQYDKILDECNKIDKNRLILLSLGPAAKPLTQDLYHEGYRVIDIGNLDHEYTWFLAGYQTKKDIKHLPDEVLNDKEKLRMYNEQIIARVM